MKAKMKSKVIGKRKVSFSGKGLNRFYAIPARRSSPRRNCMIRAKEEYTGVKADTKTKIKEKKAEFKDSARELRAEYKDRVQYCKQVPGRQGAGCRTAARNSLRSKLRSNRRGAKRYRVSARSSKKKQSIIARKAYIENKKRCRARYTRWSENPAIPRGEYYHPSVGWY